MKLLILNCGSSSLKFRLAQTEPNQAGLGAEARLCDGTITGIGGNATIALTLAGSADQQRYTIELADQAAAVAELLRMLRACGHDPGELTAAGHRVVHGGDRFEQPVQIDGDVLQAIEAAGSLAPLHNAPALAAIRGLRDALGADLPMVACFDTTFHRSLPERAWRYAIPRDLADRYHLRRFGFHGLAHRYMSERYALISDLPSDRTRLITLQLGNGCSIAAIDAGRSIDTSMGLTPLEGLVMGTRSGDVDPSLIAVLGRGDVARLSPDEAEHLLNSQSGLLGLSGTSADMRELLQAEQQGDAHAALAIEIFCYRVRRYLGGYMAVLGGATAVIFGGGIGEHNPDIRRRICAGMDWCGLRLDDEANQGAVGAEQRISPRSSAIDVMVIPVDEAAVIVQDTVQLLGVT